MGSKKIIVTGASRGIGLELVKQLLSMGHELLALTRNTSSIAPALSGSKQVTFLETDITTDLGLTKVVGFVEENWQKVDVVIHNAGALIYKPLDRKSVV